MSYTALGAHVFMGGFTRGVLDVMPVKAQLETHGLGADTVRLKLGVEVVRTERWEDWPQIDCDFLYGNPRCTGFSCVTAGCGDHAHGPWANQTKDIHDLISYAMSLDDPPRIVVWESVQQAYSTGRPLLRYLAEEVLAQRGYKVCHVLLTAASFGNAQNRKRYFFVAYRGDRNFNVAPPELPEYRTILRDVIEDLEDSCTGEWDWRSDFSPDVDHSDHCFRLPDYEREAIEHLEHGWDFNMLARYKLEAMPERMQRRWRERGSDIPFSMHCCRRLCYDTFAPTLFGGCHNLVHPTQDRTLTLRELSRIMGNDFTPVGKMPCAQIAKGICPQVGTWLAQQAVYYLDDVWGDQDFASRYDARGGAWIEGEHEGANQKTFHMNEYRPYRCRAYERWQRHMKLA